MVGVISDDRARDEPAVFGKVCRAVEGRMRDVQFQVIAREGEVEGIAHRVHEIELWCIRIDVGHQKLDLADAQHARHIITRRQGLECGSVGDGGGPFQVARIIRHLRGPI